MSLRGITFLCLTLGLFLLNGCGFALRGTTADTQLPLPFKCLTVVSLASWNANHVYRRLQRALTRQGVNIDYTPHCTFDTPPPQSNIQPNGDEPWQLWTNHHVFINVDSFL